MSDDNWLWMVTAISMLVACTVAESVRFLLNKIFKKDAASGIVMNFSISTFIMIVCTYEKIILAVYQMKARYFVSTFFVCLIYSRLFHQYQPNPIAQFHEYWESRISSPKSILLKTLVLPLMGQFIGLYISIYWLDAVWKSWLTNSHVDSHHIAGACIPCLKTGLPLAFLIEGGLATVYILLNHFIDARRDKGQFFQKQYTRSSTMAAAVCLLLYMFMDYTGAFANPFLAYALERNCLNDIKRILMHVTVYTIAPILATILHLTISTSRKHMHET